MIREPCQIVEKSLQYPRKFQGSRIVEWSSISQDETSRALLFIAHWPYKHRRVLLVGDVSSCVFADLQLWWSYKARIWFALPWYYFKASQKMSPAFPFKRILYTQSNLSVQHVVSTALNIPARPPSIFLRGSLNGHRVRSPTDFNAVEWAAQLS